MKKLLIGPAGSGKTHRILEEFVSALKQSPDPLADDFFLILPSAEHVERVTMLVCQHGLKGFFKRRITTLSEFIRMMFSPGDVRLASSSARFMMLRDLLKESPRPPFEAVQSQAGFTEMMLHFFSELKESLVTPEDFRARMNAMKILEPALAVKYETLASLFESYEERLKKEGLVERQDLYRILKERQKNNSGRASRIQHLWLDGFFDFTPLQRAYLGMLSESSEHITVTLTQDPDGKRGAVFQAADETEKQLKALGFQAEALARSGKRFAHPALAYLEEHLFRPLSGPGKKPPADPGTAVRVFEAVGLQGEIEMIAREIVRLVRTQDLRFSECAVLLRHIGPYEAVIRSVFERYGIPHDIHEREHTSFSPWMHTVHLLLRVFADGWKRNDLLDFLKSPYVKTLGGQPKSDAWVYQLEHAALERGVSGIRDRWLEEWKFCTRVQDPEAFEKQKKQALGSLAALEDGLRKAASISEILGKFKHAVLKDFGMASPELLSGVSASRDLAAIRRFESLLEEIRRHALVRGRAYAGFDGFYSEFSKLAELDLYSVHFWDKNRVQVYDVSLARQKEYRAVFIAGLLEKVFPLQIKEDPVLSDWERRLFNGTGAPALAEKLPRQSIERYFFYLAATRARDQVILTYPRLDREGKESLPSFYADEVKSVFRGEIPVTSQDLSRPYLKPQDAVTQRELEHAVMGGLFHAPKAEEPLLLALTRRLFEDADTRCLFQRAFYEVRAELRDTAIQEGNYFRTQLLSPSRLEEYAKCPFKYFSSKVLKLKDPHDDPNARHAGTIRHKVMEEFFGARSDQPLQKYSEEQIRKFVQKSFRSALEKNPLIYEKHYQHVLAEETIQEELVRVIQAELERLSRSQLQPGYFELAFGPKSEDGIPALVLPHGQGRIAINGIIDRIDFDLSRTYALVVDYKPSSEWSRKDLEFGISLQLPIYVKVVEDVLRMKPVGAELYAIKKRKATGFYHADLAPDKIPVRPRALKLPDPEFRALVESGMEFIRYFSDQMKQAVIEVKPRKCEDYCEYSTVCRIQKWRREIITEEIKEEDKKRHAG